MSSMRTVIFGNQNLTDYFYVQKISRSILPPREIGLLEVPARHGAYFTGLRYGVRKIDIEVMTITDTPTGFMNLIRTLAKWLDFDKPTELFISDEPDKIQYAVLSGDTEISEELLKLGKGTLSFICPDPFAYSNVSKTITPVDNMFTFNNGGTATTFPKFDVNFQKDASFVSFISAEGVILVGQPSDVDQIKLPAYSYALNDPMTSNVNWANAGSVLDEGRVNAGSVVASGDHIKAQSYGSGTKVWHGPAIRRDLPSVVKDFEVKVRMNFKSQDGTSTLDGDQQGRLEIYLFNQSGGKIGKLVMRDSLSYYEFNVPEIYIGNSTFLEKQPATPTPKKVEQKEVTTHTVKSGETMASIAKKYNMSLFDLNFLNKDVIFNGLKVGMKLIISSKTVTKTVYPTHVGDYNDFFGEFTLSRIGTKWNAEISSIDPDNWRKSNTITKTFYDKEGKYTSSALSHIVINYLQYGDVPVVQNMSVTDVKVLKHNTETVIDVPSIFRSGDHLEIDLSNSGVWLNGERFLSGVDVGTTFFPVPSGLSEVKVNTDDNLADIKATFTERFL